MKTILLDDDADLLVESLIDFLEVKGYRIVPAENGKNGLARLETEETGLAIAPTK